VWVSFFCWKQKKIFWWMLVTRQLIDPIGFHGRKKKIMAAVNCLVTNILQNIFVWGWVNDHWVFIFGWTIPLMLYYLIPRIVVYYQAYVCHHSLLFSLVWNFSWFSFVTSSLFKFPPLISFVSLVSVKISSNVSAVCSLIILVCVPS